MTARKSPARNTTTIDSTVAPATDSTVTPATDSTVTPAADDRFGFRANFREIAAARDNEARAEQAWHVLRDAAKARLIAEENADLAREALSMAEETMSAAETIKRDAITAYQDAGEDLDHVLLHPGEDSDSDPDQGYYRSAY